jgi:hypothetical protein
MILPEKRQALRLEIAAGVSKPKNLWTKFGDRRIQRTVGKIRASTWHVVSVVSFD